MKKLNFIFTIVKLMNALSGELENELQTCTWNFEKLYSIYYKISKYFFIKQMATIKKKVETKMSVFHLFKY